MLRNEFWIISTLLSVGVIGGILYNWPAPVDNFPVATESTFVPDSNRAEGIEFVGDIQSPDKRDSEERQRLLQKGDNYLSVGNFSDALRYFVPVFNVDRNSVSMLLRLGWTYELSGNPSSAEQFFKKAIQLSHPSSTYRHMALLGQARCWVAGGRPQEAIDVLCEQFLTISDNKTLPDSLKADVGYELCQILHEEAIVRVGPEKSVLDRPVFETCEVDVLVLLAILEELESTGTVAREAANGQSERRPDRPIELIQRPGDDVNLMVVRGSIASTAVNEVLQQLSQIADLEFEIPPEVATHLAGRSVKMNSEALPLGAMLDCIFYPLNVAWMQSDQKIILAAVADLDREQLGFHRAEQGVRLGRQIIVNFPNGRCRDILRLSVAGLNFLNSNYDDASAMLTQLSDEQLTGELNAKIKLNLGMLETRLGRFDSAKVQFLGAVDQSFNDQIKALAYTSIARIDLLQYNLESVVASGFRGLALAEAPAVRRQASLDLARAYLMLDNPVLANKMLFENRAAFGQGIDRTLSLIFGAYARSLGTISEISKRKAVETLVIALAGLNDDDLTMTVDRVLLAKAYRSISLSSKALKILDVDTEGPDSEIWDRRRAFDLALLLHADGNTAMAAAHYRNLALVTTDAIGQRAQLEQARYELTTKKNSKKCLTLCRQLLDENLTQRIKNGVLKLMGEAFQAEGRNLEAAYCFSGQLPLDENQNNPAIQ